MTYERKVGKLILPRTSFFSINIFTTVTAALHFTFILPSLDIHAQNEDINN
jgi:hypothetical protein